MLKALREIRLVLRRPYCRCAFIQGLRFIRVPDFPIELRQIFEAGCDIRVIPAQCLFRDSQSSPEKWLRVRVLALIFI